ncbi:PTB domain-containing engulfment adapter protein 1-like [Panonychus citri]|uniref:PTB domain-containing engulfment adapter protein 1-like n=1 Tax=Panonychus citri TaxID=50023 RepID=UPI002306FC8C|nr:PTB domain-containing engulfment adapter protein 1-like [Panonychus citri]
MMKQGSLLRWSSSNGGNKWTKNHGKPNWIHPPDALQHGHVAYLVKFLGKTEVDQPKGIDVVKEGIRKMKFSQHLRRAEGTKTPKVELTISVDGVAIQDPKSKKISFQYPLHRISYCADDKSDPKFFSFIAKEADSNRHSCFVFVSDKLSEEITLTIGQAFELAYRRFLETSGRDLEMRKQIMVLHKKVQELEAENRSLKNRLTNYENKSASSIKSSTSGRSSILTNGSEIINTKLQPLQPPPPPVQRFANRSHHLQPTVSLLDIDDQPIVGRKLENLSLDDQKFDPRSFDESNTATSTTTTTTALIGSPLSSSSTNSSSSNSSVSSSSSSPPLSMITTPNQPAAVSTLSSSSASTTTTMTTITSNGPINSYQGNGHANNLTHTNGIDNGHNQDTNEDKDIFGFEPFDPETNKINDPFGMESFEAKQLEQAIGDIDKKLAEMRDGFSRGLSFGYVDFSMETLTNT